jgi:hypothetical protein
MTISWPNDDARSLSLFYGNPCGNDGNASPAWMKANLVGVTPPWRMVASWNKGAVIRQIQVHKKVAPSLERVLKRIWDAYGHSQAQIEVSRMHLFGGGFNFRPKRGLSSLSLHAYGAAIDLDPEHNGLGQKQGTIPQVVIDAFKAEGWVWGGDWKNRPDPMHFQAAS